MIMRMSICTITTILRIFSSKGIKMQFYIVLLSINGGFPIVKAFDTFNRAYKYMADDFYSSKEAYGLAFDGKEKPGSNTDEVAYIQDKNEHEPCAVIKAGGDVLRWALRESCL